MPTRTPHLGVAGFFWGSHIRIPMSSERIRTSLNLQPETKRRLDSYSAESGRSKLHIAEAAINRYLDSLEREGVK